MASLPPLFRRVDEEQADMTRMALEASSIETVKVISELDKQSQEKYAGNFPCIIDTLWIEPAFSFT